MADDDKKNSPDVNASSPPEAAESLENKDSSNSPEAGAGADALEKPSDGKSTVGSVDSDVNYSWNEKIIRKLGTINPYLVLFILVLIIGGLIAFISNRINQQADPTNLTFEGEELDQAALDELLQAEQNIGTVDQTLTVAANAIFNGKILVKSDLDVAGSIRVGGPLNLPGITVSGESEFDDVNVNNNLAILGSASVQQSLTVQGGAQISGNVSVGGTISAGEISADQIEFTGDLNLTRHIDTGGSTPSIVKGSALGIGGTVSLSGNDIAGTVTINTGGGPPTGIFVRLNFRQTYNSTPVVQITPVGSAASTIDYYVERTTSQFSIGTTSAPAASTTYRFDYFIVE